MMADGARLLVVDDEPDVELLIKNAFRKEIKNEGWLVEFAQNGQEAVRKVQQHGDFDLLLTDINMPVMDGLTLLQELNVLHRDMKALVVSAYGDIEKIRRAMQNGAMHFVTKPVDLKDLQSTVKKTLEVVRRLKRARQDEANRVRDEFLQELRRPVSEVVEHSAELMERLKERDLTDLQDGATKIHAAGLNLKSVID